MSGRNGKQSVRWCRFSISNFAFEFSLRRYTEASPSTGTTIGNGGGSASLQFGAPGGTCTNACMNYAGYLGEAVQVGPMKPVLKEPA
jgi:hypothetical protein